MSFSLKNNPSVYLFILLVFIFQFLACQGSYIGEKPNSILRNTDANQVGESLDIYDYQPKVLLRKKRSLIHEIPVIISHLDIVYEKISSIVKWIIKIADVTNRFDSDSNSVSNA